MKGDTEKQVKWFVLTLEVVDEFTANIWRKLDSLTSIPPKN